MSRIVLLTEFFPPANGGIQQVMAGQAGWLGADVMVVAPPHEGDAAFDARQKYSVIRRSLFSGRGWPRWWWLITWLRKQRQSGTTLVVFGHYSRAVTAGWLAKKFFGIPYAVYTYGNDLLTEIRHPIWRWFVARQLREAAWINVTGAFMRDQVHRLGIPLQNIISSIPVVEPAPDPVPEHVGHRLVTVCRLVARKNVGGVLRAVAAIKDVLPELRYDVVGDGPERAALEELASQLGITDMVTFHGRVDEATKETLLRQSDCGIMIPTELAGGTDVEGFGIFFLEAARWALPVIASRSGGVADAVRDGETGILVDPNDHQAVVAAIRKIFEDRSTARQLGLQARALVNAEYVASAKRPVLSATLGNISSEHQPRISVIIPAFNAVETLPATLASLAAQTCRPAEIIIVNDGSTDNLDAAVQPWAEQATIIRQEHRGAPVARNLGAEQATGKFLLFCDADVVLRPEALAFMARTLAMHPEASYAYANFRFGPKNFHPGEFDAARLRRMNYIHTTSLIRREHFPGFDPALKKFQDWDLWLTMAARGRTGIWIPERLYTVIQRRGGMSAWRPSFMYRLPWIGQGHGSAAIQKYRAGEQIIKAKHKL